LKRKWTILAPECKQATEKRCTRWLFKVVSKTEARSQSCRQFQKLDASEFYDSENMFFTGKVLFTLNANVTNQNNKYWCLKNPHSACEVPLQMKLKSGAVSAESKGLCLSRKCEVPTSMFN
jgi:hypothetical protein